MTNNGRETIVRNRAIKSIGTGIGSLTSGGREFYILEHKTGSSSFKAGQQKEIIVDYLELGRDPNCAIRYSENELTVSRRHAAINKENGSWVLLNLSKVNPTLLNGRPVYNKYYLNSGDEIQLSMEGPKLGFIIPNNNKTGSLSIGKRMSLFTEQALRPYKQVIAGLLALLVLLSLGAGYFIFRLNRDNKELQNMVIATQKALQDTVSLSVQVSDSMVRANNRLIQTKDAQAQQRMRELRRQLGANRSSRSRSSTPVTPTKTSVPAAISALYKDVYLVKITNVKLNYPDGSIKEPDNIFWAGTGFLTKDNRFVTTRDVIEPWFYLDGTEDGNDLLTINILLHNYGVSISYKIEATSSAGKKLSFERKEFRISNAGDQAEQVTYSEQDQVIRHATNNSNDIAWTKINKAGTLETNADLAKNIRVSDELYALGYPLGFGNSSMSTAKTPNYKPMTVGESGIQNGTIKMTNRSATSQNTGGPVLMKQGETYQVVGVAARGWGKSLEKIIPISAIY